MLYTLTLLSSCVSMLHVYNKHKHTHVQAWTHSYETCSGHILQIAATVKMLGARSTNLAG